jgi:hypothetical protein
MEALQQGLYSAFMKEFSKGKSSAAVAQLVEVVRTLDTLTKLESQEIEDTISVLGLIQVEQWPEETWIELMQPRNLAIKILDRCICIHQPERFLQLLLDHVHFLVACKQLPFAMNYCGYIVQRCGKVNREVNIELRTLEKMILFEAVGTENGYLINQLLDLHSSPENKSIIDFLRSLKLYITKFASETHYLQQICLNLKTHLSILTHCYHQELQSADFEKFFGLINEMECIANYLIQLQQIEDAKIFTQLIINEAINEDEGVFHTILTRIHQISSLTKRQDFIKQLIITIELIGDHFATYHCYEEAKALYNAGKLILRSKPIERTFGNQLTEFRDLWLRNFLKKDAKLEEISIEMSMVPQYALNHFVLYRELLLQHRQQAQDSLLNNNNNNNNNHKKQSILSIVTKWNHEIENLLLNICVSIEAQIGASPIKYAMMVLGSLARGEGCPYSDIEFALILQKSYVLLSKSQQQYFKLFLQMFELRIIALGKYNY